MSIAQRIAQLRQRLHRDGLIGTLRYMAHKATEAWYDQRFGIITARYVSLTDLGMDCPLCSDYAPFEYKTLLKLFADLEIRADVDVLLDYGSGMGRVLIVAGTLPFKRVIGVEFISLLNDIARQNIDASRKRLRCHTIEIVEMDAKEYAVPDDVTVVILFNPFKGAILAAALEHIRLSLALRPRPICVVYIPPAGTTFVLMDECEWLVRWKEYRCYPERVAIVYRNR